MSKAFIPTRGKSITPTATSSSGSTDVDIDPSSRQIRVRNTGTVDVCIDWYDSLQLGSTSAPACTTAEMALAPGAIEVFTKGSADKIRLLSTGADCVVKITPGTGE